MSVFKLVSESSICWITSFDYLQQTVWNLMINFYWFSLICSKDNSGPYTEVCQTPTQTLVYYKFGYLEQLSDIPFLPQFLNKIIVLYLMLLYFEWALWTSFLGGGRCTKLRSQFTNVAYYRAKLGKPNWIVQAFL